MVLIALIYIWPTSLPDGGDGDGPTSLQDGLLPCGPTLSLIQQF